MKKLLLVALTICMMLGFAFAEGYWEFNKAVVCGYSVATNDGAAGVNLPGFKNAYAVTVAPDGKIWFGSYYSRRLEDTAGLPDLERYPDLWYEITEKDTGTGAYLDTVEVWNKPIFVYDPATEVMDTIRFLEFASGEIDTLVSGHRGAAVGIDGNIIYAVYDVVYKINYQTYVPMEKWVSPGGQCARLDTDADGYIFVTTLFGGAPVYVLDPDDLTEYTQVTANQTISVTRGLGVSADGKDVYIGGSKGIHHYHSDDGVDGTYALVDTLFKKVMINDTTEVDFDVQLILRDDTRGFSWVGSFGDVLSKVFFGANLPAETIADSSSGIIVGPTAADTTSGGYALPEFSRCVRDAAFSPDGTKMYFADFYGYTIKEYVWVEGSAIDNEIIVVNRFNLKQNYPNPFNPTTVIPFSIQNSGLVKLTVYNTVGQEVRTLVHKELNPGEYNIDFDATGLATGMYIYRLTLDGSQKALKMLYVK